MTLKTLKTHLPLLLILLILFLHLALSLSYASLIPLGEAPDERAHLNYARFIAERGHLPLTLAERQAADYRANWPPLYHALIAGPVGWVGDQPPTRLKAVGDTARRLIPTNGQTIAAFIHTEDEAWPWRGLPLAWHLSRFVSVSLTALSVLVTYLIAWQLTRQRRIATLAAAIHAFIPQIIFVGSVLNDDNLLILLSGLLLLVLVMAAQQGRLFKLRWAVGIGLLLGLATVAKYNALPLWGVVAVWYGYQAQKTGAVLKTAPVWTGLKKLIPAGAALLGGAALSGGWWFIFIWRQFNQVEQLGWWRGSFAALVASTSDATLRNVAAGGRISLPPLAAWLDWPLHLFQSFWGRFGGGGSITFPLWVYWLLALFCLLTCLVPLRSRLTNHQSPTPSAPLRTGLPRSPIRLFLLTPLFFLPLPLLRFILTGGNITETAQGRHLFPAISAIALALAWGLGRRTNDEERRRATLYKKQDSTRSTFYALRFTSYALPLTLLTLSLTALPLIRSHYPPPIPLRTTAEAATAENLLNARLTDSLTLVGYDLGPADNGRLPVTLVWQATGIPPQDYLINLTITDAGNQPLGSWLGHPVGGRYPTRAWDAGDILRHTSLLPLLPDLPATQNATLTLQLLDSSGQTVEASLLLTNTLSLPATPAAPLHPDRLRADGLPNEAPFAYRSTLSFVLPNRSSPPNLVAPDGRSFAPTHTLTTTGGSLAHFLVAADWPSGNYRVVMNNWTMNNEQLDNKQLGSEQAPITNYQLPITNRPRQFQPPPLTYPVEATFGGMMTLLGYDLPQRRVEPGENFPITLHWQAERTMGQNLVIFNHLLDAQQIQRGGQDRIPLNHYATLLWVPGEIVSDSYVVPVAAEAPPGVYWLDVGLYGTERPDLSLPLFENGRPIDRTGVLLGPIKVGGPPPQVTTTTAQPQQPVRATFGEQITLLGFDLTDPAGQPYPLDETTGPINGRLTLYWQVEAPPAAEYTVFLHLVDAQGDVVAQFDGPPAGGLYPTTLWEPGEIIKDERPVNGLWLDGHQLQVGLYRPDTGERLPLPGTPAGAFDLLEIER